MATRKAAKAASCFKRAPLIDIQLAVLVLASLESFNEAAAAAAASIITGSIVGGHR